MTEYNPLLFSLQRNIGDNTWVTVPAATFTWSSDYTIQEHKDGLPPSDTPTLVIGSETATVSYSRWEVLGTDILFTGDRIRARYNGVTFFLGTVESVNVTYTADDDAVRHGATRRIDVECAVGGYYADMLSRTVHWGDLVAELWIERMQRFVDVTGW
jgi:hypothetical protein